MVFHRLHFIKAILLVTWTTVQFSFELVCELAMFYWNLLIIINITFVSRFSLFN